ncbi:hypothetical protein Sjap_022933 [Stephania japonica]|uniref:Uncharacterized protein n=1 Tax=Stephania japonica TaxID=461633 RepID=A0AAP0EQB5_9MAGN
MEEQQARSYCSVRASLVDTRLVSTSSMSKRGLRRLSAAATTVENETSDVASAEGRSSTEELGLAEVLLVGGEVRYAKGARDGLKHKKAKKE